MSEPGFCPHCGYNLTVDAPITVGDWLLSLDTAWFKGTRVFVTPYEAGFLHTLAKAAGRPVKPEVIANRIGSTAQNAGNVVSVMVHRLRDRLPVVPFETAHGNGYRWAA